MLSIHPVRGFARCRHFVILVLLFAVASSRAVAQQTEGEIVGPPLVLRPPERAPEQISAYIREVFQDRNGVYWFGTNGDGVARYDGRALTYLSLKEGFGGTAVRGIVQDAGGALWFATDGGVSRYEAVKFTNYTKKDGLSDDSLWSILCDKSGTIWVGTQEGVCRFNGKRFEAFPLPRVKVEHPESRFTPKVVFAMREDRDGNLWFGTDGEGVHRYDGKSFKSFTTKDGLAGNMVRSLCEDGRGRMWVGTDGGGVSCYDGKAFRNYTHQDGLGNDRVFEIYAVRSGDLWFSTLGAGASVYDGKTFRSFGVKQGLVNPYPGADPANVHVQEFFEDRVGILWLGCSGGLFSFDGKAFTNVTKDGPWPMAKAGAAMGVEMMAPFERMIAGEWRMTCETGMGQFEHWQWGPGRQSTVMQTYGNDAMGGPWRAVQVTYWHPVERRIRVLTLHQEIQLIGRGVGEGTIVFDGRCLTVDFQLRQGGPTRPVRTLRSTWVFDGEDKYLESLTEDVGAGYGMLASWVYTRSKSRSALPPVAEEANRPGGRFEDLAKYVGRLLEFRGESGDGRVDVALEWIPYVQAVYCRVERRDEGGKAAHALDAFLFEHTATERLHCLALSESGGVYEGDVTTEKSGVMEIELKGFEGTREVRRLVRVELGGDDGARARVWRVDGTDRSILFDIRRTGAGAGKD